MCQQLAFGDRPNAPVAVPESLQGLRFTGLGPQPEKSLKCRDGYCALHRAIPEGNGEGDTAAVRDDARFEIYCFFDKPHPAAHVLVMGHILRDWSLDQKRSLLRKCYGTLLPGGRLIVYEAMIDDERPSMPSACY